MEIRTEKGVFNYEKRMRLQSSPEKVLIKPSNGYIFFVTLLSIPESSFSAAFKMFDLDHNGSRIVQLIVNLEFAHYDHMAKGTISAKDFALSMVASSDINHIGKFLDRAEEVDGLLISEISGFFFGGVQVLGSATQKSQAAVSPFSAMAE
ncbi:hypothetical protein HPP92_021724 [Vanilla planifolia]|uniref:Uncharacterized protein n=1 Tax=Vanilla planifolia TaxID=51239 RepID=A0A835Q680_VANPL|nr:hypothetical protein HPP92_021724 [Vanilla planifolia]